MTEKKEVGIKETLELINGFKHPLIAFAKISADGKVSVKDLEHLIELSKKADKILEGAKGADLVFKEVKDLDEQEVIQLVASLYGLVKAFKNAKDEARA